MHDFDQQAHTFKADIYVIRADGSDLKGITGEPKNEFYTSWAKGRIAFGVEMPATKDSDIFTANPSGSDMRQITKGPGRNSTPALSRDGKKIAFVSTRDGGKYQIYVANSDGSNLTRLTKDSNTGYFNPQWSPDGKKIVYYAEKGDQRDQIWTMSADGSNQILLTDNIGHNTFPGWSPNGRRIIFSSSKRDKDADGSYIDGSYLYIMNADGSGLRKLGDIKSFFARFSPDGKKIAYISGKFPATAIYIANSDGSAPVKITK
jgi:TolB protein